MTTIEKLNTSQGSLEYRLDMKDIKNLHISINPPTGEIRVSAPKAFDKSKIEATLLRRMSWIRRQILAFEAQPRQSSRRAVSGEDYYLRGRRYQLEVRAGTERGRIQIEGNKIILSISSELSEESRLASLDRWYRLQLISDLEVLIPKFELQTGISTRSWSVRKMKTRWGTCQIERRHITINSELIKKDTSCLEYILIHELIHLLEPSHNANFIKLLDHHLPNWKALRSKLNSAPLAHAKWDY
jgi:predicted metal-dependent hydrolase